MRRTPTAAAVLVWGCAAVLAACGGGAPLAPTSASSASAARDREPGLSRGDAAIGGYVVLHHGEDLLLARLALTRSTSSAVIGLAREIQTERRSDLNTLRRQSAGAVGPARSPTGTALDVDAGPLAELSGRDFDRFWAKTLTSHLTETDGALRALLAPSASVGLRTLIASRSDDLRSEIDRLAVLSSSP